MKFILYVLFAILVILCYIVVYNVLEYSAGILVFDPTYMLIQPFISLVNAVVELKHLPLFV